MGLVLRCTIYDQLIRRTVIQINAIVCHILTLKCTKLDFGWGFTPDPAGAAHSPLPDLLVLIEFKGLHTKKWWDTTFLNFGCLTNA